MVTKTLCDICNLVTETPNPVTVQWETEGKKQRREIEVCDLCFPKVTGSPPPAKKER